MKKYILIFALLVLPVLFFGCLDTGPKTGNGTPGTQNLTAQYGDNVTVDYSLRVDGKVIDTSLINVAKNAGIYYANRSYQPLTFQMILGGTVIKGFVNGVLGMKVGDSKNFTIAPADGYGLADPKMITNMSRYYNMSVFEEVPVSYFKGKNITLSNSTVFPTEIGYVAVHNITNSTVTLRYLLSQGNQFALYGLPQTVLNITNYTMLIRFDMQENKTYLITDPFTNKKTYAKVTYADNQTIVLDENPPLAGKELDFEVTLRSITRK